MKLKNRWYLWVIIFSVILCVLVMATTTTDTVRPSSWASSAITITDANNLTTNIGTIQGKLTGIVIDSTGTDTSFKVYIKDEHAAYVFSKEDCSSSSEPYRYALTTTDTAGTTKFLGVPVSGDITVQVADAAGLTGIIITVYFERTPTYGL